MNVGPIVVFGRRDVRRHWLSLLAIALVTAASCAFVFTALTAARRSETALARFEHKTRSPGVMANTPPSRLDEVAVALAAEPGVVATSAFAWLPIRPKEVADEQVGGFAALLADFVEPLVIEGRLADPQRADEFTINQPMQRLTGLRIGDSTTLLSRLPGLERVATVVGIVQSPFDLANRGEPSSYFSVALGQGFREAFFTFAGDAFRPAIVADTAPGADVDAIIADLSSRFPDSGFVNGTDLNSEVRRALATEARAYWALTAAAAFATAVALGQILVRSLRHHEGDATALRALGSSTTQRTVSVVAPLALAVIAGVTVAVAAAFPLSALVPSGLGKRIDPASGTWVDVQALIALASGLVLVFAATLLLAGWRVGQPGGTEIASAPHYSPSLLQRSAARLLGARAAFGGPDAKTRHAARNAILTAAIAITGVVAVPVWSASLDHLRSTPRTYGWNFDITVDKSFVTFAEQFPVTDELAAQLAASNAVKRVERVDLATVTIHGVDIDLWVMTPVRGSIHPTMQAGREPTGSDEIALAEPVMAQFHAGIGQTIDVQGSRTQTMSVVGQAVYPNVGNGSFGYMGSVSPAGATSMGSAPYSSYVLVDLAPGKSVDDVRAIVGDDAHIGLPAPPSDVGYLSEVGSADDLLALFLALLGAATIVHAMTTSARRRRDDHPALRAMGMNRTQLSSAFGWQGLILAAVALVVGIPAGIIAGRVVWWLSTRNLPVLDAFRVPVLATGGVALATLGCALLSTIIVATMSTGSNVAHRPRSE